MPTRFVRLVVSVCRYGSRKVLVEVVEPALRRPSLTVGRGRLRLRDVHDQTGFDGDRDGSRDAGTAETSGDDQLLIGEISDAGLWVGSKHQVDQDGVNVALAWLRRLLGRRGASSSDDVVERELGVDVGAPGVMGDCDRHRRHPRRRVSVAFMREGRGGFPRPSSCHDAMPRSISATRSATGIRVARPTFDRRSSPRSMRL